MLPWLKKQTIRVAVIGDIILDEYLEGSVTRISPEAPVPVHLVRKSQWTAGGAANTARNIQLAGGQASLFGVWGQDEAGRILRQILTDDKIQVDGVLALADRPTIKKTRITAGHQQMLRVDWEQAQAITVEQQQRLMGALRQGHFDGVLVSDYGKGGLPEALISQIFAYAEEKAMACVVDPKGKNFHKYRGSTLLTPNRKEACEALGLDPEEESTTGEVLGRRLQEAFGLADVLVTMGAAGMVYVPKASQAALIHKAPRAREVFDVSGAGDTVAAMMALVLAAGEPPEVAMEFANLAAGLVVEKWGTQPIYRHELEEHMAAELSLAKSKQASPLVASEKIIERERLLPRIEELQAVGKRFVFTNGCFDILHAGHLTYLEKARALGDYLVVGVNSDESIAALKGKGRPIVRLEQRMKLLSGLSCIDFIVPFGEETPLQLIELLKPQILVKGADYREEDIVGAKVVKALGGQVKTIPLVAGLSTTEIIKRIKTNGSQL